MVQGSPRKKSAVFIINSLAGGGAERVMTTLLRASGSWRDRYDISLVLLDREPGAYPVPDWIDVVQFDTRGNLVSGIRALRRLIAAQRPDVTLSFLTRANVANVAASAGLGIRCIISERVNSSAHFGGRLRAAASRWLLRFTYPRADHVVAVSYGVADDLARNFSVRENRISVIANPVDHDLIAECGLADPAVPVPEDYVAAAGRLVPNKNFAMLIEAFARSELPGSLVILGEGPERANLEAHVARLGLEGRVHLPGFVENPFAILRRASLFALPSNAEGFPNGLVEAMACGLPVVATNCASGPSEILLGCPREEVQGVVECDAGIVVPTNDVAAFTKALRMLDDPEKRKRKGDAAAEITRAFDTAQTANRYWETIETTLAVGQPSPLARHDGMPMRQAVVAPGSSSNSN
ncbi:glycosyltransferase [Novosphingobium malaysiense]|uniref:glycosyltransferase n=1 Tax=Novosphingobium malaysiense TaxID=1348853 RepID=UPI0022B21B46|nr:glycosyltransferase [Novosphingobium malaysiense]